MFDSVPPSSDRTFPESEVHTAQFLLVSSNLVEQGDIYPIVIEPPPSNDLLG